MCVHTISFCSYPVRLVLAHFQIRAHLQKLQKDQQDEAATLNIANTEFNNVAQVSSKPETFLVS